MPWRFGLWLGIVGLVVSSLALPVRAAQDVVLTIVPAKTSMCFGSGATNTINTTVMTAGGQPVVNQPVVFTLLYGTGTISPTVRQTALDGSASTTYTASDGPNQQGLIVIGASVTDATGVHREGTTIMVQSTGMVAESRTILSNPGSALVGDLMTTQMTLAKEGPGTPALSVLRLTYNPMTFWACGILPRESSSTPPASAYTMAHLDTTAGIDSADLTFAYTDPGKHVGLHWWNVEDKRWRLLTDATVDPATSTVHLHVTPTTSPSLADLTAAKPFFVVVALNQQWLPLIARSASQP